MIRDSAHVQSVKVNAGKEKHLDIANPGTGRFFSGRILTPDEKVSDPPDELPN